MLDPQKKKIKLLPYMGILKDLGLKIYATKSTSKFLAASNVEHECVPWPGEGPNDVLQAIKEGKVDLVINIPKNQESKELTKGYQIRKASVEHSCSLLTNMEKSLAYVRALSSSKKFYAHHQVKPLAHYL